MTPLAGTLRARREELGLGQDEVAQRLGVTQQTVSRWEHGAATPRPVRLLALAGVLDVEPQRLQRLAGIIPVRTDVGARVSSHWKQLFDGVPDMTTTELMLLIEVAWRELRQRDAPPPYPPYDDDDDYARTSSDRS